MRVLLISISVSILLSACETAPVQPEETFSPEDIAIEMMEQGLFYYAAEEYLRLADINPEKAVEFKLNAADAYIKDHQPDVARMIVENTQVPAIDSLLSFRKRLLMARLALVEEKYLKVLEESDMDIPLNARFSWIDEYYSTRSEAYDRLEDGYAAARELIILDNLYLANDTPPANSIRIWNHLMASEMQVLSNVETDDIENLSAWLGLVILSRTLMARNDSLNYALQRWVELNPEHPANPDLTDLILDTSLRVDTRPNQIALLLPLTGVYERFSETIRDGFLSAWFNEQNYRPVVRVYNTDSQNFDDIYTAAVENGADFIVGPLEKESVRLLANMQNIPVRTLALNQIAENEFEPVEKTENYVFPIPELVQFGLPPEDEAVQVAERGILEGYNRALVITPSDEYGERVYNAFSIAWEDMGGTILERIDYNPQTSDFITPIKKLLNIDSSEMRINELRQRLGRNLNGESRLREDVEFVFMVATNLTARQIVPHLRFFRVEDVPIYTISAVYTGKQNAQVDRDLNGVEFVDIPWLLGPENQNSELSSQIREAWQTASGQFPRYYAFGVDAFRLISQIPRLSLNPAYRYQGETGRLYMTHDGQIHRNLIWARFNNGVPEPVFSENTP
jgi:outer membrane PBP1 activator LpoA protein